MKKVFHLIITLFLCFTLISVTAQIIGIEEYHQENGLPTDLIKALAFDNDGYLWVAVDGGLVKMECNDFIPVKNIEGSSNYYKNILFTKSFGFIAASDDGLISILDTNEKPRLEFTQTYLKNLNIPDSKYSKSLYEASDSSLWIATNFGIIHLTKTIATSISLPSHCLTNNYLRNHQFFEINEQIYIICQKGFLYKIDSKTHQLIHITWQYEGTEVFSALAIEQKRVLIGTNNGLVQLQFTDAGTVQSANKLDFPYPVSVLRAHAGNIYLGTWSQGAFEAIITKGQFTFKPINNTANQTINDLQFDSADQLWVATNFGVLLIRNLLFKRDFVNYTDDYIQDIATNGNQGFYFTDGLRVASVDIETKTLSEFYFTRSEFILQLLVKQNEVWMTTNSGKIIIRSKIGTNRILDFSDKGQGITTVVEDKLGNIWLLQNRVVPTLVKISPNNSIKEYIVPHSVNSFFTTLEINTQGELFIGGFGINEYLFRYDYENDSIINLSESISGLTKAEFGINDLTFSSSGKLILGTSEGVWEYNENTIRRIDLDKANIENVPSVCFDQQERLWFVNSGGLILWDGTQTTVFNNYDGLPSTTISARNLLFDNNNNLWIGTNLGIASGQIINKNSDTPKPKIKQIEIGLNTYSPKEINRILIGSPIKIYFTSSSYPTKHLNYKFSLSNDENETWSEIKKNTNYLLLEHLKPGKYHLKLKVKGKGYYNWSEADTYEFVVYKKWYTHYLAIGLFYVLLVVLITFYLRFISLRAKREKKKLEEVIEQRTKTLLEQNEELKILNNNINKAKESAEEAIKSKDRFFSIVAHDLKSPFNTLIGFSELLANNRDQIPEESMQEVFEEMLKTSENTYKLLQNLLDWARSQTGALVVEKRMIKVSLLLQEVLDTILPAAKQKNIQIIISQEDNLWIYADISLMATSIRNILSNALKFSYPESIIELSAQRENDDWVLIKIKDKGVGIPEDKIPFLFSIENNTSSIGTASEKGTGLGLILCKEFVERCNGTILVESKVNKGSLFTLNIPAKS